MKHQRNIDLGAFLGAIVLIPVLKVRVTHGMYDIAKIIV